MKIRRGERKVCFKAFNGMSTAQIDGSRFRPAIDLHIVSMEEIRRMIDKTPDVMGIPTYVAWDENDMWVFPLPDANYVITMEAKK